jgi:hypothetical protein
VAGVRVLRGDTDKKVMSDRVAGLIKQLGDDYFAKREAASKALEALGEIAVA